MPNLQLNIDILRKDNFALAVFMSLLPSDFSSLGRYVDIKSIDDLLARLSSASYEFMRYLPLHNLLIYRTSDIGIGYSKSTLPSRFKELMSINRVSQDTKIHLNYKYGNIYTSIDSRDIDLKLLLTDETYIIVYKDTNEIYAASIGKFTNPNRLFFKQHLDKVVTNFHKASTLLGFNRIDIIEEEPYLYHIP